MGVWGRYSTCLLTVKLNIEFVSSPFSYSIVVTRKNRKDFLVYDEGDKSSFNWRSYHNVAKIERKF